MVCANDIGCHKLASMLIGKYNRPACFAHQKCPLKYGTQKYGWTFQRVGIDSMKFLILSTQNNFCRPVLLIMDNDTGNFEAFQRENVVVRILLPM